MDIFKVYAPETVRENIKENTIFLWHSFLNQEIGPILRNIFEEEKVNLLPR